MISLFSYILFNILILPYYFAPYIYFFFYSQFVLYKYLKESNKNEQWNQSHIIRWSRARWQELLPLGSQRVPNPPRLWHANE